MEEKNNLQSGGNYAAATAANNTEEPLKHLPQQTAQNKRQRATGGTCLRAQARQTDEETERIQRILSH